VWKFAKRVIVLYATPGHAGPCVQAERRVAWLVRLAARFFNFPKNVLKKKRGVLVLCQYPSPSLLGSWPIAQGLHKHAHAYAGGTTGGEWGWAINPSGTCDIKVNPWVIGHEVREEGCCGE
jgi:hypothetical protein